MFTTVSAMLTRLSTLQDGQAWEVFDRRYSRLLRGFFSSRGVRGELARDLTQETIRKAVEGLRAGAYRQDKGRLRDWIRGIAQNVLREYWRKAGRRGHSAQVRTAFWEACPDPTAGDAVREVDERFDQIWVRARLADLLRHARSSFNPRDLRCYFLVEVHKRPIAEVAERLGISVSLVYERRRAVAQWFRAVSPRFISNWEK